MKLMLAGLDVNWKHIEDIAHFCKYLLLSFWYIRKSKDIGIIKLMQERNAEDNFILDSGAFTLMMTEDGKKTEKLEEYIEDYIEFIKKYQIKRYIEMDIDVLVGYERVLEIRKYLESQIGYPCIPVWHMSRGIAEYKKMVAEYDYVAIGGLVAHVKPKQYPLIKELAKYGNSKRVKVHGLGFTRKDAHEYGFYSVDSSSWSAGRRFGHAHIFNNNKLTSIPKPLNSRANYTTIDRNNFIEWCKYQRYMERK